MHGSCKLVGQSDKLVFLVEVLGLRAIPSQALVDAGRGQEKQHLEHNTWPVKQENSIHKQLGWDLHVPHGDLSLQKLDELFSIFFTSNESEWQPLSKCNSYVLHDWLQLSDQEG